MKKCFACAEEKVDTEAPPQYDVFNPQFVVGTSDMGDFGPYCDDCWPTTPTAQMSS